MAINEEIPSTNRAGFEQNCLVSSAGVSPTLDRMTRLLLTILLLAACARDPLPGPLPPEALPLHAWPAHGEPRAVILALHGFGDAGDLTFDGAARAWSARGIAVYAPDQRGFGANPSRHDWPGVDALTGDAAALSRWTSAPATRPPLVVVGHSMGGGIALAAAARASTPTPSSSPAPPLPAARR